MANESNGKIFISIHLNGNPNKSAYGFETYLLRPGKTEDAIEVASRENEVIKLEDKFNYGNNGTKYFYERERRACGNGSRGNGKES